ncbi:MAG: two-component system sensor histidine kinase RstB [bacterium]|jgi:two-component system sensor histidine kinase RstB
MFFQIYIFLIVSHFAISTGVHFLGKGYIVQFIEDRQRQLFHGSLLYIQSSLEQTVAKKWEQKITDLQSELDVTIQLVSIQKLIESKFDKINQLKAGKVVVIQRKISIVEESVLFLKKYPNRNIVIKVFLSHQNNLYLTMVVLSGILFSFGLGFATYIWLRPRWKKVVTLLDTIISFGKGNLSARAPIYDVIPAYELAQTFNQMADSIQHFIESRRILSNAIAHELRTPIARICFGTEILRDIDSAESREKYIDNIDEDIEELQNLVDEILVYARIENQFIKMKKEDIPIASWLEDYLSKEKQKNPALPLSWDVSLIDCVLSFEPKLLSRAIQNIVLNAARYAEKEIQISLEKNNNLCWIHIDDDGCGIPNESKSKVFDAFVRLKSKGKSKSTGYGLGLSIVKRIVHQHQAQIVVTDSLLGGARFSIGFLINKKM